MPTNFVPTNGFDCIDSEDEKIALKWFCPPEKRGQDEPESTTRDGDERKNNDEGPSNVSSGWWKVNKSTAMTQTSTLHLAPPAKRDFWRKTYYQPLLVKDDAPFLYRTVDVDTDLPLMVETSFVIHNSKSQFDQAGIMVRIDHEHWVKTGIEIVDGIPRLSCVVTNGFSDWSTQVWTKPEIRIRVHVLPQHGGSVVVEAAERRAEVASNDDTNIAGGSSSSNSSNHQGHQQQQQQQNEPWSFIRIAHLNRNMNHDFLNDDPATINALQGPNPSTNASSPPRMMVGVFGACPVDQTGMFVIFDNLSIQQGSTFVHEA